MAFKRATKSDRIAAFNRSVRDKVAELSPEHGEALDSRGIALGWWQTIDYLRIIGRDADHIASVIAAQTIPLL